MGFLLSVIKELIMSRDLFSTFTFYFSITAKYHFIVTNTILHFEVKCFLQIEMCIKSNYF